MSKEKDKESLVPLLYDTSSLASEAGGNGLSLWRGVASFKVEQAGELLVLVTSFVTNREGTYLLIVSSSEHDGPVPELYVTSKVKELTEK